MSPGSPPPWRRSVSIWTFSPVPVSSVAPSFEKTISSVIAARSILLASWCRLYCWAMSSGSKNSLMSTGVPWSWPSCGVSLGSSESVKFSRAPSSERSSWPCPWPCPRSSAPIRTRAKNASKISSNDSSSRMSLTSETRRAALSVSRSASTPGSRAQRMASRTSEVEIRTCRMRSSRTKRWMLASMSGGLLSLGAARARGACRGPRRRSGCPGRGSPGASSGGSASPVRAFSWYSRPGAP